MTRRRDHDRQDSRTTGQDASDRSETGREGGLEAAGGAASTDRQAGTGRDDQQESARQPETGARRGMAKNESVDAAVELSERGGIRPENTDAETHHDRSRDRGRQA
jgi:hypothetical protein